MTMSRGEKELQDLERVFKALAHASRRQVLIVLNARGGEMTAGEIAGRFSCTWPTTTRHMRVLERAGLLAHDRVGRTRRYRIDRQKLDTVRRWLGWFDVPGGVSS